VIIDGPEQRADTRWINDGGPVDDFWCSQRPPQIDGRIALGPAGSDGIPNTIRLLLLCACKLDQRHWPHTIAACERSDLPDDPDYASCNDV
jgi:hypothetical protein